MENEFVTYEQAVDLKELGFDEPCFKVVEGGPIDIFPYKKLDVPLYQQAFRWFREKYNLHGQVNPRTWFIYDTNADYKILNKNGKLTKSYEEAELACLKKLIEICKTK